VTVVDPVQTGFDWQTLFVYMILLGLLGLVGYGIYSMFIAKVQTKGTAGEMGRPCGGTPRGLTAARTPVFPLSRLAS